MANDSFNLFVSSFVSFSINGLKENAENYYPILRRKVELFCFCQLTVNEKVFFVAGGGGGGSYFPDIFLNEIQTMFSQLAKRSARVLPADLCTDHAHYVKKHGSRRRDCFSLLYFGNSQIY